MTNFSSTEWQIRLPDDWRHKGSEDQDHFEGDEGTKAIFISAWDVGADGGSAGDIAESFRTNDLQMLEQMEDTEWITVADDLVRGETDATVLLDNLNAAESYRIVTKILVRPPVAVRASFHDYLCEDYEESRAYFAPIVESLKFRG